MKYIGMPIIFFAALVFLFFRFLLEEKNRKAAFEKKLSELWGKVPFGYQAGKGDAGKRTGRYLKIFDGRFRIDEITWEELDMDEVFSRMDYTMSQMGAEYLYETLHCPAENKKEAEKWEETVSYFSTDAKARIKVQMLLAAIGKNTGKSNGKSIGKRNGERTSFHSPVKEYLTDLLYLAAVVVVMYDTGAGLCALALLIVYQILSYFRERAKILPFLKDIAQTLRLMTCLEKLERELQPEICSMVENALSVNLHDCIKKLETLKRHSFWVLQCGRENSSPLSMVGDYIRMLFHVDIVQFLRLTKKMQELEGEIQNGAVFAGFLDSSISIALYRASLENYCLPELLEETLKETSKVSGVAEFLMTDGYHPLLEKPVSNSIVVYDKGVLLTGSNASGKSTFLKTVAVNLLLAQTIHTTLASRFRAPISRIYTSMGARDDILKGESSYMAEILSLKRILDAGEKEGKVPIFCFVDEILRGTNTVERIAASAQILKYFSKTGTGCFAATHDSELITLLKEEYEHYYFTEEIKNGDICFPYRLLSGSGDTGNAIRLLAATGYHREITEGAERMAADFRKERVWK